MGDSNDADFLGFMNYIEDIELDFYDDPYT